MQDGGVEWDVASWDLAEWFKEHMPSFAEIPRRPSAMVALHGVAAGDDVGRSEMAMRIDVRAPQRRHKVSLARLEPQSMPSESLDLDEAIENVLVDHFASVGATPEYKARVLKLLSVPLRIQSRIPETVKIWSVTPHAVERRLVAWDDVLSRDQWTVVFTKKGRDISDGTLAGLPGGTFLHAHDVLGQSELLYGFRAVRDRWNADRSALGVLWERGPRVSWTGEWVCRPGSEFGVGEILRVVSSDSYQSTTFVNVDAALVVALAGGDEQDLAIASRHRTEDPRHRFDVLTPLAIFVAEVAGACRQMWPPGDAKTKLDAWLLGFFEEVGVSGLATRVLLSQELGGAVTRAVVD